MSMFFGASDDMPEPIKQFFDHVQNAHTQQEMRQDMAEHDLLAFVGSLDQDQLRALSLLLFTVCANEVATGYYLGIVKAEAKQRFNICPHHNVNHDEQLSEVMGNPTE